MNSGNQVRRFLATALLGWFCIPSARPFAAENELGGEQRLAEHCPIRIGEIAQRLPGGQLEGTSLYAEGLSSIDLPASWPESLFVLEATGPSPEGLLVAYYADSMRTKEYPLSLGLRGITWDTVAKRADSGSVQGEIPAGYYRIMLRYVSPKSPRSKEARVLICQLITSSFEVPAPLILVSSG